MAEIAGIENSALHFIPEEYLSPFTAGAADAMLKTLGKRCGLQFTSNGRNIIASTAAYQPYWMRMLGSYIHRHVELEERPVELSDQIVQELCEEFAQSEGGDIARIALHTLYRVDQPMYEMLQRCAVSRTVPKREASPLLRYGLVRQRGPEVDIQSLMVQSALELLRKERDGLAPSEAKTRVHEGIELDESEWAEEVAAISRRRNILERKAREFIRVALKMGLPSGRNWVDVVLAALPSARRLDCAGLAPDALMGKLYWIELSQIMAREWSIFERFFQDKRRLQTAFTMLNERPDAHAKEVDLADVALQRRELTWLEERISQ